MQFAQIDNNGVYKGAVEGIPADVPDSFCSPTDVKVSNLGLPPTDDPGKWRDNGIAWVAVTPQDMLAALTNVVQRRLDDFAQTRNYDGVLSAASYATSTNPKFAAEGQYAVNARDATWAACYAVMDDVLGGLRPIPMETELMAELPALEWPV